MPITLLLHIALAVPATGAVSTPVVHAALVETARIWAPTASSSTPRRPAAPGASRATRTVTARS
jgi:hypothetical protein